MIINATDRMSLTTGDASIWLTSVPGGTGQVAPRVVTQCGNLGYIQLQRLPSEQLHTTQFLALYPANPPFWNSQQTIVADGGVLGECTYIRGRRPSWSGSEISLTPTGITFQCGPNSMINIDNTGVTIKGLKITIVAKLSTDHQTMLQQDQGRRN